MSKYDDFKKDLDTLYKLTRENEDKCRDRISKIDKDYIEINVHLKNLAKNTSDFIESFEKHDKEEMDKYNKIESSINKMNEKLNKLSSLKEDVDSLKQTQRKAIKYFYIGSGILITLGALGSFIVYLLNVISKYQAITGG